ncbi:MAG TPA: tRNA (adenosine(37)-N6)-dimethylallyltransferase MiaA, partial [Solirubrobacterales bacterium]|nr:tRNA (adenosine(37)-N6)-dimethylallyltransferase MiaA [Solirubrobacterales bacterium]
RAAPQPHRLTTSRPRMDVVAIFGPTAVGKTGVAIELANLLRERGEDPVAIGCDSIQVYRGLEILSGAPTPGEREQLEHRLVSIADVSEEFSAGRFAKLAHDAVDRLLAEGRRPIVVGGTGLYLRAALAELELRPPVPAEVRAEVEADLAERGSDALHAELPAELSSGVHPNDGKRIVRLTELTRLGIAPHASSEGLWTEELRAPSLLFGLTLEREELHARIDARVEAMIAAGATEEAKKADEADASRTARAAIGFDELLEGDVERMKSAQRAFARRQLTWMRRMPGVELVDRTGLGDDEVARAILGHLGE